MGLALSQSLLSLWSPGSMYKYTNTAKHTAYKHLPHIGLHIKFKNRDNKCSHEHTPHVHTCYFTPQGIWACVCCYLLGMTSYLWELAACNEADMITPIARVHRYNNRHYNSFAITKASPIGYLMLHFSMSLIRNCKISDIFNILVTFCTFIPARDVGVLTWVKLNFLPQPFI